MHGGHIGVQSVAPDYPTPEHGDCRLWCGLETACTQTIHDRKGPACLSAEAISDARAPSHGEREKGNLKPLSAPPVIRGRSCLATLYAVTSIPPHNDRRTSDHAIQKPHSGDAAPNPISAQQVDPSEEMPAPDAETQVAMLCAATAPSVCGGQTRGGYECGCREQEFDYYVDSIMDGLTVQSPIMIPRDEPSDVCRVFEQNEDEEKELLRAFMRVKSRTELPQGLIIDATHPELAPHIVISPPTDSPYDSYCSCGSCDRDWPYTPPQYTDSLVIPLQQWSHSVNDGFDVSCDQLEPSTPSTQTDEGMHPTESGGDIGLPYRVFSRSWFTHSVEAAEEERLVFYHVMPAIHKRCFRLAALAASEVAPVFRARWESEEFRKQMERPFSWTDPAEPLLTEYARQPNTIVIDSVNPFAAPHIVISEALLQNPWELDCIYAPPQNCYYGHFLTHPSYACVGPCCLSSYPHWFAAPPQEFLPPVDVPEPAVEPKDPFDGEGEDESESDSDASTDTPQTPQDGGFVDIHEPAGFLGKDLRFHIEEDDDDLPPFDDWYRNIALRAC